MSRDAKVRAATAMAVAVLAIGTAAVGVSFAQQPAQPPAQQSGQAVVHGRGMMRFGPLAAMRRGLAQLGLSDEQKQQVRTIVQGRKEEFKGLRRQMRQARLAVDDAIANDAGEVAIRARSADLAKVEADLAVFRAEVRKEVLGVLTPEQRAKAKELRLAARKRFERFWAGR